MGANADSPHLPYPATIEAYGKGGFRFAGMSHRGSLLCLPDGIWAWPVSSPQAISAEALARVFARAGDLDLFILGTGRDPWIVPDALRQQFRELRLTLETMPTGSAVGTYNVLLAEGRRVAAGFVAAE